MRYWIIICALISVIVVQCRRENVLREERDQSRENCAALINGAREYQTRDSLNAAEVYAVTMSRDEYKRNYDDAKQRIAALNTKNRDLDTQIGAHISTIAKIKSSVRDTIIYRTNNVRDTLRCIDARDAWVRVSGCADKQGNFDGTIEMRDTLLAVVTVKYKRFLGFLWRTSKVKDKKLDIVTSNPHNRITSASCVIVRE